MSRKNILKLCSDQISKDNLNDFLTFLAKENVNIDELCYKYYNINKGWLDLDMREKRNIGDIQQIKKTCSLKYLQEKAKMDAIAENYNYGLDLLTYEERYINEDEQIITVFPTGTVCKTQELYGYYVIIKKGKTFMFNPLSNTVKYVSPNYAETLDDKKPNKYTFIDATGAKHECKYLYSKRTHKELYDFITSIY